MILKIEKRDLFTVPKEYILCHCISADFALGAGIAKKFAELGVRDILLNFEDGYKWKGEGDCVFTNATEWGEFNLITKEKYWHKPTIISLGQALCSMRDHLIGGDRIAMPKIGCGLDRLKWEDVEQMLHNVFDSRDVEILVCDWK